MSENKPDVARLKILASQCGRVSNLDARLDDEKHYKYVAVYIPAGALRECFREYLTVAAEMAPKLLAKVERLERALDLERKRGRLLEEELGR